jgi:hypothetical protein
LVDGGATADRVGWSAVFLEAVTPVMNSKFNRGSPWCHGIAHRADLSHTPPSGRGIHLHLALKHAVHACP